MERKPSAGSIRNRERSEKKFLEAVAKLLKTKGYTALKVNDIAETAGVDKKMIYTYFGGMDGLMDEYLRSQNHWSSMTIEEIEKMKSRADDGGKSFLKEKLWLRFDYLHNNKEALKLLLWRLSETRKSLKKLDDNQEQNGEYVFRLVTNSYFGERAGDFQAIMAILTSGLYYVTMYSYMNGSHFCGIDTKSLEGRERIKKVISFLLECTYDKLSAQQR